MGVRESLLNTITSVADSDFVRIVTSAGASSKATVRNLFKGFESNLSAKSSLTTSDYIRVVGSDNESYKQTLSAIMSTMGVTDLNTKMGTLITCPTVSDLNEATSPNALYKFNSDASNKPTGLNYGYIFVLAEADGKNTQQIVVGRGGTDAGPIFRRGRNASGVWGSWEKAPTRAEIDALKTTTSSILTISSGWTADANWCRKRNGICEMYVELTGGTYSSGWNTVATLPGGYRPLSAFDSICVDNGSSTAPALDVKIGASGAVQVYKFASTTNNIRIHATFICE